MNPLLAFAGRRLGLFVVSIFILVTASFGMIHAIPGDPVRAALGMTAPQALVEQRTQELGLDRPLVEQYVRYIVDTVKGDLGRSSVRQMPVSTVIGSRLPPTFQLAGAGFAIAIFLGIPLGLVVGVLTHHGRSRRLDMAFSGLTGALTAVPQFLLGVLFVFLFAVSYQLLPVAGRGGWISLLLPAVTLGLGPAAALARIVRVETHRVLNETYMQTARAKRLPARRMYVRHVLPNALAATLTVAGLILGGLLAGTVLIENVFAWPGLGTELVQAILAKDYRMVQGLALVFGAGVLIINTLVDLTLAIFDPRSTIVAT